MRVAGGCIRRNHARKGDNRLSVLFCDVRDTARRLAHDCLSVKPSLSGNHKIGILYIILEAGLLEHDFNAGFKPRVGEGQEGKAEAARSAGALGAKLTGGGLGGCVIALVTGESATRRVRAALEQTGAPETWSYRMRISEVDE